MKFYLEHANITVSNIDDAIRFFTTAFPHLQVRGKGESLNDAVVRKWLHLGTDETYIALEEISSESAKNRQAYQDLGINHIGFVVEDFEGVIERLKKAGYKESIGVDPHPHRKRAYYYDQDGNEYEFIEYLSDDFSERNEYK